MVWLCGKSMLCAGMMRGFVLFIMLVYLQILSLLAMRGAAAIIDQKKSFHHQSERYRQQQNLLIMLDQVDAVMQPACVISKTYPLELLRQDVSWWKRHGCQLIQGKNQYFFVRERLQKDDCAVVTNSYNHLVIPVYYRNTLLYDSGVTTLLVQDTIVLSGSFPPSCSGVPRKVREGRQMLRVL